MLVDDERRYVFLHIPKNAGQAVAAALGHRHESAHHTLEGIGRYRSYFRFCFVRDPLDRFVSAFRYSVDMVERGRANDKHPIRMLIAERGLDSSVQEFVEAISDLEPDRLFANVHFRPQMRWIARGRPQFIGRCETLAEDLERIGRIVGLPSPPVVERVNASKSTVDVELDKRARSIVRSIYEEDYRYLGYDRPWLD